MFKSIRWNFLSWLSLILLVTIGGFGATLYDSLRRSKLDEIDAELEGAARVLAERIRSRTTRRSPRAPSRPMRRDGRELDGAFPEDFMREFRRHGPRGRRSFEADRFFEQVDFPADFRLGSGEESGDATYFAIWRRGGESLSSSDEPDGLVRPERPSEEGGSYSRTRDAAREVVLDGPRGCVILVGRSIDEELANLNQLLGTIAVTGLVVLFIGLLGGWFVAKRAIRPIESITLAAQSISASNLSQRVDIESTGSELGNLATVLNTTFGRLQEAFEQQARFTADASHELRTPVSVILAQTAMARRKARDPEEYREVIDACYVVASRMKSLVNGLLTLARTDSGDLTLQLSHFDLKRVVEECAGLIESLAAERGVAVRCDLESVKMQGDPDRLTQVISNLLANAVRYNREGGEVRVKLEDGGEEAIVSVSDSGFGIAATHLPHIFDRFYRVDTARSVSQGGTGLGLAISKAIVEAHGGIICCESAVAEGSTFTVRFPKHRSAG